MQYLDIIENISLYIEKLEKEILLTTTSITQFEINCKNENMLEYLKANLFVLNKFNDLIGMNVYGFENTKLYSDVYKEGSVKLILTEDLYNKFIFDYFENLITILSESLVKNSLFRESSNSLYNICFQWQILCKQEIIKYYRKLINK